MEREAFSVGQLTNAGFTLMVNGRKYRFAELRVRDYGLIEDHLRRLQPKATDSLAKAVKEFGFTPEQLGVLLIVAYERDLQWPSPIDTVPGMQSIMNDEAARIDFIRLSLAEHQPELTEAEAADVAGSLSWLQLRRVLAWGISGKECNDPGDQEDNPLGESPSVSTGTPESSPLLSNSDSVGTRSAE